MYLVCILTQIRMIRRNILKVEVECPGEGYVEQGLDDE